MDICVMKMSLRSKYRITVKPKNKIFMKKLIIIAALGLFAPLMSMAQTSLGPGALGTSLTVPGSPHNFSGQAWNVYVDAGKGKQICQPCHTPHNAQITMVAPLWNHQYSTASYTFYKSIKDTSTVGVTEIDGTSKLCLSCHDGTVALGSFGGQTGSTFITGNASLGTDLSNDHPVSVSYDYAYNGGSNGWGGLRPKTEIYNLWVDSISSYGTSGKAISTMLDVNGKVQCTSCHGAHANSRGYQLRMDNRGSALCLACHKK
jgi:predicted CXXCH cytochrome family protein